MENITWSISIKAIFKDKRNDFVDKHHWLIRESTFDNIQKILLCWTKEAGFASFKCSECSEVKHIPFSCKSRFCNSCSKPQSDLRMNNLLDRRPSQLLYHHVTFTIPKELRPFFRKYRNSLRILPYTAAKAVQYFTKKQQKVSIGIMGVIHTFGSQLNRNPHTHLLVSHWWFHENGTFKQKVFLPYKAIATSWTRFLIKNLKERVYHNVPEQHQKEDIQKLNEFYDYHSKLSGKSTNRYVDFWWKPRKFQQVVGYLWRYLKRPALSQSRIISYANDTITFSFVDKRDNKKKAVSCSVLEFIWLLVQHLPNKNFRMVYYYGIFANRCKNKYLQLIKTYFDSSAKKPVIPTSFDQRMYFFTGKNPLLCSCWGVFCLYKLSIPWYPDKFFDSW